MKYLFQYIFLFFGLALTFVSCSPKDSLPKDVLSVEKMSAILLDFELAEAYNPSYYRQSNKDSIYPQDHKERLQVFYQQILQMHDIDTATFFHSFHYYSHHPDWIKKVYTRMEDSVQVKLASIQKSVQEKRQKSSNRIPEFLSFWKKDLKTLHSFYDSTSDQDSRILYPWEANKIKKVSPVFTTDTYWTQYYSTLHDFYDLLRKKQSRLLIPGVTSDD